MHDASSPGSFRVSAPWAFIAGVARRHAVPLAIGLTLFFGLNLVPVLVMGRSDSLGNNTDGIYHYLKILRLRGELAPDPSFDLDVRLPTDQRLYGAVNALVEATGWSLVSALQAIWCGYSILFVVGSYALGVRLGGFPWAGAFFAASGWGFALALGGHWGWDYSPIVPHDLAAAFVPWLLLLWVGVPTAAGLIAVVVASGVLSQVYPTTFVHFVAVLLVAQLVAAPRRPKRVLLAAGVFGLVLLPLVLTWTGRGPIPEEFLPLFRQRFSYLAPATLHAGLKESRVILMQLALAAIAAGLLRATMAPPGWRSLRALGWVSLLMPLVGWWTVTVPRLAPLFVSRASMFAYPWILLTQARAMRAPGGRLPRCVGVGLCLASLLLRPNLVGPFQEVLKGRSIREAVAEYHPQDTAGFRELCAWIEAHTAPNDLLLTPPDDRYLFLRAYAQRPLAGLIKDLGAVHTPSPALMENWHFILRSKSAFQARDIDSLTLLARLRGCRAVVFPPEWVPGLDLAFANSAGGVLPWDGAESPLTAKPRRLP
jgi:hypothetical protein